MEKMTIDEFYAKANASGPMTPYVGDFEKDAEEAFKFDFRLKEVKSAIHAYCYDKGHSGGYSNIACYYTEIVNIVDITIAAYAE